MIKEFISLKIDNSSEMTRVHNTHVYNIIYDMKYIVILKMSIFNIFLELNIL